MSTMTLNDVVDWTCRSKMRRPDLMGDTLTMATDAMRSICSKVPFDELQTISAELPMTANQQWIDISGVINPPIAGILSVRASYSTTRVRRLIPTNFRVFENRLQRTGEPAQFARVNKKLYFDKTPTSAAWTIRLFYWSMPVMNADPGLTVVPWEPEWDELHKYETLYRVYMHIEQADKALMLMSPTPVPRQYTTTRTPQHEVGIIPRLWNDLLKTTSMREASDQEYTVNPVVRTYTAVK